MKLTSLSGLIPAALLSIGVAACGGSAPDLGKMQNDFNSPSGSAKDDTGVVSATAKQDANTNSPLAGFSGGGVPGLALRSNQLPSGFAQLAPRTAFADVYQYARDLAIGQRHFALGDASGSNTSGSCFSSQLMSSLSGHESVSNGAVDASASASIDLSKCGNGLSGTMDVDAKIHSDPATHAANMSLTMELHNVCDSASGACIDGGVAEQVTIKAQTTVDMTGTTTGGSANETFIMGWNYTAKGVKDINGNAQTITLKGGVRTAVDASSNSTGGTATASLEYLLYVHDSKGAEVSYVLKITATASSMNGMATGQATLEIRCKDGTLTCTKSLDGSAMCTGTIDGQDYSDSWDSSKYMAVESAPSFKN